MPAPIPITPVNHLKSIDDKLTTVENLLTVLAGLVNVEYDEVALAYTGTLLTTVEYKLASVTVATLTLSYTGTLLTGVVRT